MPSSNNMDFPISKDASAPTIFSSDAELWDKMQEYARATNNPPYSHINGTLTSVALHCTSCAEFKSYARGVCRAADICDERDIDAFTAVGDLSDHERFAVHACTLNRTEEASGYSFYVRGMIDAHCCDQGKWRSTNEKRNGDDILSSAGQGLCKKIKRAFRDIDDFGRDEIDAIDALESILVKITSRDPTPQLALRVDELDVDCRDVCDKIDDVIESQTYDESDDVVRDEYERTKSDIETAIKELEMERYKDLPIIGELLDKLKKCEDTLSSAFAKYEKSIEALKQ